MSSADNGPPASDIVTTSTACTSHRRNCWTGLESYGSQAHVLFTLATLHAISLAYDFVAPPSPWKEKVPISGDALPQVLVVLAACALYVYHALRASGCENVHRMQAVHSAFIVGGLLIVRGIRSTLNGTMSNVVAAVGVLLSGVLLARSYQLHYGTTVCKSVRRTDTPTKTVPLSTCTLGEAIAHGSIHACYKEMRRSGGSAYSIQAGGSGAMECRIFDRGWTDDAKVVHDDQAVYATQEAATTQPAPRDELYSVALATFVAAVSMARMDGPSDSRANAGSMHAIVAAVVATSAISYYGTFHDQQTSTSSLHYVPAASVIAALSVAVWLVRGRPHALMILLVAVVHTFYTLGALETVSSSDSVWHWIAFGVSGALAIIQHLGHSSRNNNDSTQIFVHSVAPTAILVANALHAMNLPEWMRRGLAAFTGTLCLFMQLPEQGSGYESAVGIAGALLVASFGAVASVAASFGNRSIDTANVNGLASSTAIIAAIAATQSATGAGGTYGNMWRIAISLASYAFLFRFHDPPNERHTTARCGVEARRKSGESVVMSAQQCSKEEGCNISSDDPIVSVNVLDKTRACQVRLRTRDGGAKGVTRRSIMRYRCGTTEEPCEVALDPPAASDNIQVVERCEIVLTADGNTHRLKKDALGKPALTLGDFEPPLNEARDFEVEVRGDACQTYVFPTVSFNAENYGVKMLRSGDARRVRAGSFHMRAITSPVDLNSLPFSLAVLSNTAFFHTMSTVLWPTIVLASIFATVVAARWKPQQRTHYHLPLTGSWYTTFFAVLAATTSATTMRAAFLHVTPGVWLSTLLLHFLTAVAVLHTRLTTSDGTRVYFALSACASFAHSMFLTTSTSLPFIMHAGLLTAALVSTRPAPERFAAAAVTLCAVAALVFVVITTDHSTIPYQLGFGEDVARAGGDNFFASLANNIGAVVSGGNECDGKLAICSAAKANQCKVSYCALAPTAVQMTGWADEQLRTEEEAADMTQDELAKRRARKTKERCTAHFEALEEARAAANPTGAQRYCMMFHAHDTCANVCDEHKSDPLTREDIDAMRRRLESLDDAVFQKTDAELREELIQAGRTR